MLVTMAGEPTWPLSPLTSSRVSCGSWPRIVGSSPVFHVVHVADGGAAASAWGTETTAAGMPASAVMTTAATMAVADNVRVMPLTTPPLGKWTFVGEAAPPGWSGRSGLEMDSQARPPLEAEGDGEG